MGSAPGQVHSGSSVGEKKKMDNFKLATVEAGKERDYHEMVMHRGHTPGDKSDKALKNPMHPDMTSAQSDWERKRRIKSQQKAGAAFVSNQNERWENEEQCEKRAQALRDRQMRKQDKHHAEDQEFLSEMKEKAAMKASGQAAVSNGQSAVDAHIAASEQAYAPVVHEAERNLPAVLHKTAQHQPLNPWRPLCMTAERNLPVVLHKNAQHQPVL